MTLVMHPPLHALPAPRRRRLGIVAVALFALVTLGLSYAWPSVSSWRAQERRPLPAALVNSSGGTFALGLVALDDPVTVVFGALGEPDLTSSSVTRTSMSWTFDGNRVVVTLSAGLAPVVVAIDAYVRPSAESGPVFAGGIIVGRSTMGALVGRLGSPTDVGHPMPTSVRWVRPYRGTAVVIEADAGTWASLLSSRIGHLHIGYDDSGRFAGLYDPAQR